MTTETTTFVVLVLVTLFAPIVPAYILYRTLPSKAIVKGPLQGFSMQLSGAFAGYFALVAFISIFTMRWQPKMSYEVWEVSGRAKTEDNREPIREADFTLVSPAPVDVDKAGNEYRFKITTAIKRDQNGELDFPTLIVERKGYGTAIIPFDPNKKESSGKDYTLFTDPRAKKISIENTVILESDR